MGTPWDFEQREPRPDDVAFDVHFCRICHTDLHSIGPWGQEYPLVPGHEMVGRVTAAGANVAGHVVGDTVAVSVVVDSCGECEHCRNAMEIYCDAGPTNTYDGIDRVDGSRTRGGYADSLVAHQRFVHHVPDGLDLAGAAPLLCAGVTVWSPLRHWKIGPGSEVGVVAFRYRQKGDWNRYKPACVMVGAVLISRAVDDEKLSDEILAAVRTTVESDGR